MHIVGCLLSVLPTRALPLGIAELVYVRSGNPMCECLPVCGIFKARLTRCPRRRRHRRRTELAIKWKTVTCAARTVLKCYGLGYEREWVGREGSRGVAIIRVRPNTEMVGMC